MRFFLLLVLCCASARAADEWPQFRGPDGQGHCDAARLPLTWSETNNITWKTPIPDRGWSSPVIWNDQIWMTTASEDGKLMRAVCVSRTTGKLLFNIPVLTNDSVDSVNELNSYASPSPVIEDGCVYVHFGTYGTAALSTTNGMLLWENRELKLDHEEGPGSSPVLYKNELIIPCDGTDVDYVVALDKMTGKIIWRTERSGVRNSSAAKRKAFYTPLILTLNGHDEVIAQGADYVWSYEPETGKEIWRLRCGGFSGSPRPVYGDGLLYICTGWFPSQLWAIRPEGQGDITATQVSWRVTKQAPKKPSVIFNLGKIFMASDSGIASCIEAKTGNELWSERIDGEYSASPICTTNRIYFFSQKGTSVVLDSSSTFHPLATNELDAGCMASPAVAGDAMFLRTKTHLYRIEDKAN